MLEEPFWQWSVATDAEATIQLILDHVTRLHDHAQELLDVADILLKIALLLLGGDV